MKNRQQGITDDQFGHVSHEIGDDELMAMIRKLLDSNLHHCYNEEFEAEHWTIYPPRPLKGLKPAIFSPIILSNTTRSKSDAVAERHFHNF